jgi:hypothetical protein
MSISKESLELALSVLRSFRDNSAFEDYQAEDGWTNEEYDKMIGEISDELSRLKSTATAIIRKFNAPFIHEDNVEYPIPHIDEEVVNFCVALQTPIVVKLMWGTPNINGHWISVKADIYGWEQANECRWEGYGFDTFSEELTDRYNEYLNSRCDHDGRYDGTVAWATLGKEAWLAEDIFHAYVEEQKRRYPLTIVIG